jgi:hypothetical protein
MSVNDINIEFCKAFGVDPERVFKIVVTLEAAKLPELIVWKHGANTDADKFATVIERLQLRPMSLDPGTP